MSDSIVRYYNIRGNDSVSECLKDLIPFIEIYFRQLQEEDGRERVSIDLFFDISYTYVTLISEKEKQEQLTKLKNKRSKLDEQIRLLEEQKA